MGLFGSNLPCPNLLYTHYYYWSPSPHMRPHSSPSAGCRYFFSGLKARTFLDYRPLYTPQEAITATADFFRLSALRPRPTPSPTPTTDKAFFR